MAQALLLLSCMGFGSRSFLIFVILAFSFSSQAFRCPKKTTSNHLVVTFEGLGGDSFGAPINYLAHTVNKKKYQIARFPHNSTPATIAACARRWLISTPDGKISILGQGIGGGTAYRMAQVMGDQGMLVETLVLFDSREGNEKVCEDPKLPPYKKPNNVKYVFNYYQCGRLPGRMFSMSKGVYNYRLDSTHILLPKHPKVVSFLSKVLNYKVVSFPEPLSLVSFTQHFLFGPTMSEVGEMAQREALFLVKPEHNMVRQPARAPAGAYQNTRCQQMGVSYECTAADANQRRSPFGYKGSNSNY